MLKEGNLFGVIDKEQRSIDLIREHATQKYRMGFSGGKDSICIYKLAQLAGVDFEAHYNDTTVDPPELRRFIRMEYPGVVYNRPKESMWKLILKKGPPMRNRRWCCEKLKESNPKNSLVMTGIRHEESARRATRQAFEQSTRDKSTWFVHPIIDWTELDVWEFIEKHKLKYCSLYDEGFDRIGCILCPMTRTYQQDKQRWPKMVKAWKGALRKFWDRKEGSKAVTRWNTFEEFWLWWVDRDAKTKNLDQLDLFD